MGANDIAPRLRHRVDIEEQVSDIDSETNERGDSSWESIRTSDEPEPFPAAIDPLSGREFVAAQAVQAGVTTRITMRRRDGIQATSMRVRDVVDGTIYNILAVLPDPTLRHHITLMCEQGVNDG